MWNPYSVKNFEEIEDSLTTIIFEAIGQSTMCWSNIMKAGVFDSSEAKKIGEKLIEDIKELIS